jgi:septum formation protein
MAMSDEWILASASPRRGELLKKLGHPFRVVVPEVDESFEAGASPTAVAQTLAYRKARAVAGSLARGMVIGADTVVSLGGAILGKPRDRAEAIAILSRLSGTTHAVITGVCVMDAATGRSLTASETTRVTMRKMSPEEIAAYVHSGEADGKAGAYAIQETGDRYVEKLEGDLDNVVGLPLRLVETLRRRMEEGDGGRKTGGETKSG